MQSNDGRNMTDDEIRSYLGSLSWQAAASGRRWSSEELHAKTDELPMKFEAVGGKLLLDDAQRVRSLAALVEGLGVDVSLRVIRHLVGQGERLSNWDDFLAAGRAGEDFGQELLAESTDSRAVAPPASSWNYRRVGRDS
ncbi:hypothetical protein [Inhella sp.]|uniref:hypothetical protein n=1 Tax=Inhella sp. TaxID=1921806 RepID=UPI0035B47A23